MSGPLRRGGVHYRVVAGAQLVDIAEQVVSGVPREHVGMPRLDADADERQPTRTLPLVGRLELLVPQLE